MAVGAGVVGTVVDAGAVVDAGTTVLELGVRLCLLDEALTNGMALGKLRSEKTLARVIAHMSARCIPASPLNALAIAASRGGDPCGKAHRDFQPNAPELQYHRIE